MVIPNSFRDEISLYFHIPFCKKKCGYCHFYVLPDLEEHKDLLEEGFNLEWKQKEPLFKSKKLKSVYFGGGTPYLFGPERIKNVLGLIESQFGALDKVEITLEANPENIDPLVVKKYRDAGINRISLGVQTFSGLELIELTRNHQKDKSVRSILECFDAGFENISIDLMYDTPFQTLASFKDSLNKAVKLPVTHLSLYNLTIEPGTLFFKKKKSLTPKLPSEQDSKQMFLLAQSILEDAGFSRYEISAFAKDNRYSKHNTGYWTGRPFLGFGPSAFSYFDYCRFRNISHLKKYAAALKENVDPRDFEETLDKEAMARELLSIYIRLTQGVFLKQIEDLGGQISQSLLFELQKLSSDGLILFQGSKVQLTDTGRLFYDTVAEAIV